MPSSIDKGKDRQFLSSRQLADFARDGFVYVPEAFNREEARQLAAWTEEIRSWREVPGRHMAYYEDSLRDEGSRVLQRIENFVPYHSGMQRLLSDRRMLGAVEELFGERAVLFKDKINFKLPGGDGFKTHQDQQAGWSSYAPIFMTALVTIDQQTIENGCLELAAGHHKRGLIGREWTPLTREEVADMTFVPYPSQPGDVMFFDSFTPHGSRPNTTNAARRVLYITYNLLRDGDHRDRYYADKRKNFPPDVERMPGAHYVFRV